MVSLRERLRRFLAAGVPGGPAPAGVPVDRDAERYAELELVFAELHDVVCQAEQIEADADRQLDRQQAEEQARALVAEANARAGGERAAAAAAKLAFSDAERVRLLKEAAAEAGWIDRAAAERLRAFVDELVARVLAGGPAALPGATST